LDEIGTMTDHLFSGKYEDVVKILRDSNLGKVTVMEKTVEFNVEAFLKESPANQKRMLQDFLRDMGRCGHVNDAGDKATIPRPVMKVAGVEVDLITGKPLNEKAKLTDRQQQAITKAMEQFRQSKLDPHARIAQERAIIAMEERIHIQQIKGGHEVISPSFAKFVREAMPNSEEHLGAFGSAEERAARSKAILEQELILALYDAGWSVEQLKHHFGKHHSEVREPVLRYLEVNEMKAKLTDEMRQTVERTYKSSSPEVQKLLCEQLKKLTAEKELSPHAKTTLDVIECLSDCLNSGKISKLTDLPYIDGELATVLKEPAIQELAEKAIRGIKDFLLIAHSDHLAELQTVVKGNKVVEDALKAKVLAEVDSNPYFATMNYDQLFENGLAAAKAFNFEAQYREAVCKRIRDDLSTRNRSLSDAERAALKEFVKTNGIEPTTELLTLVGAYRQRPPAIEPGAHWQTIKSVLEADSAHYKKVQYKGTADDGSHIFVYKNENDRHCICRVSKNAKGPNDVVRVIDSTGDDVLHNTNARYHAEFYSQLVDKMTDQHLDMAAKGGAGLKGGGAGYGKGAFCQTGESIMFNGQKRAVYELRFPDKLRTNVVIEPSSEPDGKPTVYVIKRTYDFADQRRYLNSLKKK
jgi:hypothetical protein